MTLKVHVVSGFWHADQSSDTNRDRSMSVRRKQQTPLTSPLSPRMKNTWHHQSCWPGAVEHPCFCPVFYID